MAKTDMANNIAPVIHFKFAEKTATVTPANGVDLQGYEACTFIITTGTITNGTWTVTFQESDEESANFVTIDPTADDYNGQLVGTVPGPFTNVANAYDDKIYKVGYVGSKQYVRCVVTETVMGTAEFGASVILGDPHSAPVATGFA
jgi:hypothetical protein